MRNVGRKLAFVLASSNHGTMIINRLDYRMSGPDRGIGVGHQLLEAAAFDPVEVELALQLIEARQRLHGDGVVAIDGGAKRADANRGAAAPLVRPADDEGAIAPAGPRSAARVRHRRARGQDRHQ